MGRGVASKTSFDSARRARKIVSDTHVTKAAEQQAQLTGKLSHLVDPSHDPIRRSLMRFDPYTMPNGEMVWIVTIGPPMPVESLVDTTGSMGNNVDLMMKYLPDSHGLIMMMLPGYDLQYAPGIFGDVSDRFVFQRGQFEMTAQKLVDILANMVPERDGGDWTEDPHYGIFAGAYLTNTYINRLGLKGYHFTVSDADTRTGYDLETLRRVFGNDVLEKVRENADGNGGKILTQSDIRTLDLREVVSDLQRRSHAFFIEIGYKAECWDDYYDREHMIQLSTTQYLPQAQAAIIGLCEGTLDIQEAKDFLIENGMLGREASCLAEELRHIAIGAQEDLRRGLKYTLPQPGDLFRKKTDLLPFTSVSDLAREQVVNEAKMGASADAVEWL